MSDGTVNGIPVGAVMYVILDPSKPGSIRPMALVELTSKKMVFRCMCKQEECTVKYVYSMHYTGKHPPNKKFEGI